MESTNTRNSEIKADKSYIFNVQKLSRTPSLYFKNPNCILLALKNKSIITQKRGLKGVKGCNNIRKVSIDNPFS